MIFFHKNNGCRTVIPNIGSSGNYVTGHMFHNRSFYRIELVDEAFFSTYQSSCVYLIISGYGKTVGLSFAASA